MRKLLIIGTLFLSGAAAAQDWQPVTADVVKADLSRLSEELRLPQYSLTFDRKVYGHYTDPTPITEDKGRFARGAGNEYLSDQSSQLVVQNADIKMVVDSALQTVVLMRPDSLFSPVDMSIFNSVWSDYKFQTMSKDGFKVYDLAPVEEGYGKYEIQLWLRADGSLAKVIVYLPKGNYQQQTMDDESEELPMIVMNYDKKQNTTDPKAFTLNNWLIKKDGGYELAPGLSERYTLRDLRYTPQKN